MGIFSRVKRDYCKLNPKESETKTVDLIRKISFSGDKITAHSISGKEKDLELILRSSEELQDVLRANHLVRKGRSLIFISVVTLADQLRVLDELKGMCAQEIYEQACGQLQKKMKKLDVYVRKLQFIQNENGNNWTAKIFPASNSKESFGAFIELCEYRLVRSCENSYFGTLENKADHLLFVSSHMPQDSLMQKVKVFYNLVSNDKENHQNYGSFYGVVPDDSVQTSGGKKLMNNFV
jgi:hypothetical protein